MDMTLEDIGRLKFKQLLCELILVTFTMKYYYTTTFARNCDDIELYFEQVCKLMINQIFSDYKIIFLSNRVGINQASSSLVLIM